VTDSIPLVNDAPEILRECKGRPVRVSLFDPVYLNRLGRFPGILASTSPDALEVECMSPPPIVGPNTPATFEVLYAGDVLWCHTWVIDRERLSTGQIWLKWPEGMQTAQRRNNARVDAHLPIHFLRDGAAPAVGLVMDISEGGLAMQSQVPLEVGERVSLIFSLGSGLFFQDIQAVVLRTSAARNGLWVMGVRFEFVAPEQQALVTKWIRTRAPNR
jgi:hypothetical protein